MSDRKETTASRLSSRRLADDRAKLYDHLQSLTVNTPLGEIRNFKVPNGNRIFFKQEYRNPTGSHYDRAILRLMRMKEEEGVIEPGKAPLLETSTGNSGASFAWLCRELGYEAEVFIPADMPSTRIAQIESLGAKVHLSPAGEYVNGLIGSFREYLRSNPKYKALNHADDEFHTIAAMNDLAREIIRDLNDLGVRQIDYFVSALGNGTTTRGIGAVLKRQYRTSIIGVEPIESPTVFQQRFPEKCRRLYGEISQSGQHGLLGTGPGVVDFTFQNMRLISEEIEDFVIVSRQDWESRLIELQSLEGQFVGHTSAACLHAALELAQRVSNKIMVQLFYDPYWKYLYVNGQSG